MVGNDTHSNVGFLLLAILCTANLANLVQHRLEHISIVVGLLALQGTHQTLKSHTRINHTLRQPLKRAVCLAVVLHEDKIPNLDNLGVVLIDQLTPRNCCFLLLGTTVYMYLGAGTARSGITHLPEVVVLVAIQNMICRQVLCPDGSRLFVTSQSFFGSTLEYRCIEVLRINMQDINNVFPCKVDSPLLEVITKRPVTEHLEHGVVIGIVSYLLQIVVLATDTQTLL